jgi:hypothetical protein
VSLPRNHSLPRTFPESAVGAAPTTIEGGLANDRGSIATVTDCIFTGNEALGGAGAAGQDGAAGNGLGGGLFNDGLSIRPAKHSDLQDARASTTPDCPQFSVFC